MTINRFIPDQSFIDTLDLKSAYWSLNKMAEPQLPDDTSSEDEGTVILKTTWEEKQGTIPESQEATAVARSFSRAEANSVVERGPPKIKKIRIKKLPDALKREKATQTDPIPKKPTTKKQ